MTIALPQICINFDGFGTLFVCVFLAVAVTRWATKIQMDRSWELDIRRRVASTLECRHLAPGEPLVVLTRPDAELTIFKRHAYRDDPSVNYIEQLAA